MDDKKYTPGPWVVRQHFQERSLYVGFDHPERGQADVAMVLPEHYDDVCRPPSLALPMAANAALIAAAPDMREALGVAAEALALPTSPEGRERALAVVRAAIAKADGRRP